MAFSLMSLVILFALGIAFTPAVMGAVDTVPMPKLSVTDVSEANGNQLEVYQPIVRTAVTADNAVDTQAGIDGFINETLIATPAPVTIQFYIRLEAGYARLNDREANAAAAAADADLDISDLVFQFYDGNGRALIPDDLTDDTIVVDIDAAGSRIQHLNTAFPDGRNFMVTISNADLVPLAAAGARYMTVVLPMDDPKTEKMMEGFQHANPTDVRTALIENKTLKWNKASNALRFELVNAEPAMGAPMVVSIVRLVPTAAQMSSRITEAAVRGPFNVKVTFTEEPKLEMDGGKIKLGDLPFVLENARITDAYKGVPFYLPPPMAEGNYSATNLPENPPAPTGRDSRYHPYFLEITPNLTSGDDVVIRVKGFNDLVKPPNSYNPPDNLASALNRSVLRVPVHGGSVTNIAKSNTDALAKAGAGSTGVFLPGGTLIPANGYLVLVRGDADMSGVRSVGANKYKDNDDRARADNITDVDFMYNTVFEFGFPAAASDFENFFRNGGTVSLGYSDIAAADVGKNKQTGYHGTRKDEDLAALTPPETISAGVVVINEIMWGRDEGETSPENSQWIELHNTTDKDISIDANEWALTFGGSAFGTEIDSVSNLSPSWWPLPGQSGNVSPEGAEVPVSLISASRVDAAVSGSDQSNWVPSERVGINLGIRRVGTPGVANVFTPIPVAPEPEPTPEPMAPVATAADLMITEIMVASNDGRLPQWIEITNGSLGEVSLNGWVLGIDNDPADTTVAALSLGIKLDGVTIGAGQSALVVSKTTNRNSGVGIGVGDLRADRIIDASSQVKPASMTYSLLSEMAFRISLEEPLPLAGGATDPGDVVGNLGGGWELPMSEAGRSSIIRREMGETETEIMGTDAAGWQLASETGLADAYLATYYGDKDDEGTPGYDAGGALPVELSKFGAKRDSVTGQVVITWETQSELNNAGFFIKRSQQKNGQFAVVNPTMIAGAGTTSEKQSYTYTDTTAQPNIVYYYQIEDVSLDGNRQTLTRAHRLKGHIGAAGKLTSTWGELKSSNE